MYLDERQVGDYRIFVVASPTAGGQYVAGCAVKRMKGADPAARPVFFDGAVSGGFGFADPRAALQHAIEVGYRELRKWRTAAAPDHLSNGNPT
jgi:hypothetical protein